MNFNFITKLLRQLQTFVSRFVLNCLLYLTQKLHIQLGGTVKYTKDKLILIHPEGRHFEVPIEYNFKEMLG